MYIEEFSPHLKENATLYYYKDQILMQFKEIILVKCESYKTENRLQSAELLIFKSGSTPSYHFALKG
jgi:hypothetical protein